MNKKIGVFDSGIGGLSTLEEIKKLLPNEDYIYYADSKNNPYGEKSEEELLSIVTNIVNKLLIEDVKLIVIACNTATTRCINKLRNLYPNIEFVGTEPAIKVACDNNYKKTILMATPSTIASERVHVLVNSNKKEGQDIILLPCEGLANAIELKNHNKIMSILHDLLDPYKKNKIDSIVLGCTHYPYVKKELQEFFPNAVLIDGNVGVANRVKYILDKNNLLNNSTSPGKTTYIQTN